MIDAAAVAARRASGLPGLGLANPSRRRPTVGAEAHAPVAEVLRSGAATLPDEYSLGDHEPTCTDQGSSETCYAHALAASIATAFSAAGDPLGWVPSPQQLSILIRAVQRAERTPIGQKMPPMDDNGAGSAVTFEAPAKYGVVPMGTLAPDGRFSDVTPANVNDEPDLGKIEDAAQHLVIGPYSVDPMGYTVDDVLRAAIYAGLPVWCANFCDSAEFSWTSSSAPLGKPNTSDTTGGGHATFLDGWKKVNGVFVYTKRGSWGSGYGASGRCDVGPDWIRSAWDLWPIAIQRAQFSKSTATREAA